MNKGKSKKRKYTKKEKKLLAAIGVVLIIIVILIIAIVSTKKGKEGKAPNLAPISEDYVEPGYGNLNMAEITGFQKVQQSEKLSLENPGLVVDAVGSYNGLFVEDGSNSPVERCLSLIVTNNTSEMIQIADIILLANEKEELNFKITNLSAGASVLVMESNHHEYQKDENYTFKDMNIAYLKDTSLMEDTFEISSEDGKLTVKNISDKDCELAYIYYKYTQRGGTYLGGITYRVPVEKLAAGKTVEVTAGHWREGSSRISMVEIAE